MKQCRSLRSKLTPDNEPGNDQAKS
jgi:hypothetical protein